MSLFKRAANPVLPTVASEGRAAQHAGFAAMFEVRRWLALVAALAVVLGVVQGASVIAPPTGADEGPFSVERARHHLDRIARSPHPMGSIEEVSVRSYIVEYLQSLGLEVEIQAAQVAWNSGRRVRAGRVENVIARLPGTDSARGAVLLVAHYDSAAHSPGAADDGAGVAALLETMRVLAQEPRPRGDVAVLFTDGEEVGLLGARAFVERHPLAKRIDAVLNFEARGGGGASVMFETSAGSSSLIEALAASGAPAVAASYAESVYRAMDNDTDLTVFRKLNVRGMNFAFFDHPVRYHTPLDRPDGLDTASLRHQGLYALTMARSLANGDTWRTARRRDAIYFNAPAVGLVVVADVIARAFGFAAALLAVFALLDAVRRGVLDARGLGRGVLAALAVTIVAAGVGWLFVHLADAAAGARDLVRWEELDRPVIGALVSMGGATALAVCMILRKAAAREMMAGALAMWATLSIASTLFAPGASYLFTVPALFSAAGFLLWKRAPAWAPWVVAWIGAYACALLWAQVAVVLSIAMGASAIVGVAIIGALFVPNAAPMLDAVPRRHLLAFCTALVLVGAFAAASGWRKREYSELYPREESLFYAADAGRGEAFWGTFDRQFSWSNGLAASSEARRDMSDYFPEGTALTRPAALVAEAGPSVDVVSNESGSERRLHLRLRPGGDAGTLMVTLHSDGGIRDLVLAGAAVDPPVADGTKVQRIRYVAPPPEGIDLFVATRPAEPLRVELVQVAPGMPDVPNAPPRDRGAVMPSRTQATGATYLRREFAL